MWCWRLHYEQLNASILHDGNQMKQGNKTAQFVESICCWFFTFVFVGFVDHFKYVNSNQIYS